MLIICREVGFFGRLLAYATARMVSPTKAWLATTKQTAAGGVARRVED